MKITRLTSGARRRRPAALVAAAVVVCLGGGTLVAGSVELPTVRVESPPDVVMSDGGGQERVPARATRGMAVIVAIDVYGGVEGTSRVEVTFDRPVPDVAPVQVRDVDAPAGDRISWTTQPPSPLQVCQDTHSFPGDKGTVDVLVPAVWLAPGTQPEAIDTRIHEVDGWPPANLPVCGPYRGHVQLALWGPASDDPAQVRVTMTDGGTRLVVELGAG